MPFNVSLDLHDNVQIIRTYSLPFITVCCLMTTITSITATMRSRPEITMNTIVIVLNIESLLTIFSANS